MQISLSADTSRPVFFFTLSLYNSALSKADMIYVLDQISAYGEELNSTVVSKAKPVPIPSPPETYPSFVNVPIEPLHKGFFVKVFQMFLKNGIFFQNKRKEPAYRFRTPDDLGKIMNLDLGEEPLSETELLKHFEKVIQYTPHYGHPMWIFQLMAG
jgi:hypothetical protein